MGKRLLISLLLNVVIVAAVVVGATFLFRTNFDVSSMQAATTQTENTPLPDLTVPADQVQAQSEFTPTSEAESFGIVVEPDETVTNTYTTIPETTLEAKAIVSEMTLEEKICQMLFVTPEVLTGYNRVYQSGSATKSALEDHPVGGIVYFASNLISTDQTQEMISNIQEFSHERIGLGLFIGVDEEGGSVARLADNLGTTAFENMAVYGQEGDPTKAYEIGTTIAKDMKTLGFNVDFAPVADVLVNAGNTAIGSRSFGSNADLVSDFVAHEVQGFVEGGVLCAPKHFPGHGGTDADSHNGYAALDRTPEELEATELKPFRAAMDAGAPMIMVGLMTVTAIDEEHPAALSPDVVTGILRDQMGYEGIIITDALDMRAVTNNYSSGEAAVLAVEAGCDMLLCTYNLDNVVSAISTAVENGEISRERIDQSAVRIVSAKLQYGLG